MYVSLTRKKAVEVESFTAASIAVRKFIELNDYGSSDFLGERSTIHRPIN
jgi:hypothetical protein